MKKVDLVDSGLLSTGKNKFSLTSRNWNYLFDIPDSETFAAAAAAAAFKVSGLQTFQPQRVKDAPLCCLAPHAADKS